VKTQPASASLPPGAAAIPGQRTEQLHHAAKPSGHRAFAAEESSPFPTSSFLSEVLVSDGDLTQVSGSQSAGLSLFRGGASVLSIRSLSSFLVDLTGMFKTPERRCDGYREGSAGR
jgi:hypothetical protein